MTNYSEANKALDKTKIHLMTKSDSAFFATLCFSMKHVWSEDIPTAACNGREILWNPDFFLNLSNNEERLFLMLHETMHAAYLHMDPIRINNRYSTKWNIACDHVINLQLIARGFTMPTGDNKGHADPKYKGMSVEEVYNLLPDSKDQPSMADLLTPVENLEALQEEMQNVLIRAVTQSKISGDKPGTVPGDIEIILDKLLNPKLPWKRILQKYMQKFNKNDYTFKRPNRRFFPQYYLPSVLSESMIDITIAVDTSCSVTDSEFLQSISEAGSILKNLKPEKITLLQFDTDIKAVDTLTNMRDLMDLKFTGKGGTNIAPVISWVNDNKPKLLLIFSDGYFKFTNKTQSNIDTIWLIHGHPKFSAPWGKTIHYDL